MFIFSDVTTLTRLERLDLVPVCLCYLEDEFLDPGSLGQEVQHGEAGVRSHGGHGHPVTSAGAGTDVVGETGEVVHERVHPTFVETGNMDSDPETGGRVRDSL